MLVNKRDSLRVLATKRKETFWPPHCSIGDYHDGAYECEFVSPYTKSAGNVDSDIFVLLQDWSSDDYLRGSLDADCINYGLTRSFPTNRRLVELLKEHFGARLEDIYATNLFPFVKNGGISSCIPREDLVRAANQFALPQIDIVRPKLVICLGLNTFNAISEACGLSRAKCMNEAVSSPFRFQDACIWCQAHTGARGQNNRGRERVSEEWRRMKEYYLYGT